MLNQNEELSQLSTNLVNVLQGSLSSPINHIRTFSVSASWPRITQWANDEVRRKLAATIFDNLREVVNSSGFYYDHELKLTFNDDEIIVVYEDDIYDFSVRVTPDGVSLLKSIIEVKTFAAWVYNIMDSIQSILKTIKGTVKELYKRDVAFTTVTYEIQILLFDFRDEEGNAVTNSAIMTKLFRAFPDKEGNLFGAGAKDDLEAVSRADYNVHQWVGTGDEARNTKYRVEAPFNRIKSTLWFTFAYSGLSYTSPNGERWKGTPDDLVNETGQFLEHIQGRAISKFMRDLLEGHRFDSASQV